MVRLSLPVAIKCPESPRDRPAEDWTELGRVGMAPRPLDDQTELGRVGMAPRSLGDQTELGRVARGIACAPKPPNLARAGAHGVPRSHAAVGQT